MILIHRIRHFRDIIFLFFIFFSILILLWRFDQIILIFLCNLEIFSERSENITRLAKLRVQVADHIANLTGTIAAEKEMGTAFASLKQQEEEAKQRTTSLYRQHNQLPAKYVSLNISIEYPHNAFLLE